MDVDSAILTRRSVRNFRPDWVASDLIRDVLTLAARAPSGGNLQPWHIEVIGGDPLAALKADMVDRRMGDESPEYPVYPENLPDPYQTRRSAIGEALYGALGIAREDRSARRAWFARNFQFFGAPLALFAHMPRFMGPPQWADLGMYLHSVMLLLRARGLDSCAQECWTVFPETVRRHVPIPADHVLFCGMAIGYRAEDAVNDFPSERVAIDAFARFHGI